jgi:hypothetical protein
MDGNDSQRLKAQTQRKQGSLAIVGLADFDLVGRAGLERVATSQGKRHILAKGGTRGGDITGDSPELQAIIDAWPSLSDDVKAGILAMVKAAGE